MMLYLPTRTGYLPFEHNSLKRNVLLPREIKTSCCQAHLAAFIERKKERTNKVTGRSTMKLTVSPGGVRDFPATRERWHANVAIPTTAAAAAVAACHFRNYHFTQCTNGAETRSSN